MTLTLLPLGAPAANYSAGASPEARARRLAHAFPNVVLRLGSRVMRPSKADAAEDDVCREKASLL